MNSWRITKYNPIYRDEAGRFMHNDWASVCDIGKSIDGNILTFESYLDYENSYVNAIEAIMKCNGIHYLKIEELEKKRYISPSGMDDENLKSFYDQLKDGFIITIDNIELVTRLTLREIVWCKLISKNMFVHFGYDYYMYVGSDNLPQAEREAIEKSGLFVEKMESPYL